MLKILLCVLLLSAVGCRKNRDLTAYTEEDKTARLATKIQLGDAKTAAQLVEGFHQVEEGGWRWTQSRFVVDLRPPFASQKLGAVLRLKGAVPDLLFTKTGPLSLTATIGATELAAVTFANAGDAVYEVQVPPSLLAAESVRVAFRLNKFLKPDTLPGDGRELGMIVSEMGWETKK